jgi:hypothetical protein
MSNLAVCPSRELDCKPVYLPSAFRLLSVAVVAHTGTHEEAESLAKRLQVPVGA